MANRVFEVYMKEGCPYSQAAKDKLEELHLKADVWTVPSNQLDMLKRKHKMDTYPHVFVKSGNQNTDWRLRRPPQLLEIQPVRVRDLGQVQRMT